MQRLVAVAQAIRNFVQDAQPAVHAADHHPHTQPGQGFLPEHPGGHITISYLVQGASLAEDHSRYWFVVAVTMFLWCDSCPVNCQSLGQPNISLSN